MLIHKSKLAMTVAAAVGLTFSAGAHATNGILQPGNGIVSQGMGGAGLSNSGEAAAGMDNPALIGQSGDALSIGWSMFSPDRSYTNAGTGIDTKSDNKLFAIPQAAFTSKINNDLSWGIMAYAMGGMNTDFRSGPNFGFNTNFAQAQTVDLSGMIIAPTLSYAFDKNVSAGASLLIGYSNFRVKNLFGTGLSNEGSAMAYGVKLGVDAKVSDGISIGAVLQPKMSGEELSFWKNFLTGMGFRGDSEIVLPNTAGVGAKFAAGKNMDIVTDIMYYQWSGVDMFEYFGWDDQIVYKVGIEFRPSDKLALRAGFNYGESPIKAGNKTGPVTAMGGASADAVAFNYAFPAVSETHLTLGVGYKMDKNMTVNAYYMHSPESKENAAAGMPLTSIQMTQNAFGLGINYAAK